MSRITAYLCVAACALLALAPVPAGPAVAAGRDGALVAAAADLQYALDAVAAEWTRATGRSVRISYGSSGTFAMQLRRGAPFELFLSADEAYVAQLHAAGLTRDAGVPYAVGRLALVARQGAPFEPDAALDGLRAAVAAGRIRRFAIANPAHAPYGRAAEEVLRRAGLLELLRPHLVLGENASQAAQFALAGGADGGLVPLSLLQTPAFAATRHAVIPADRHAPLRQRMVLTKRAGPDATAFYTYLRQPAARAILARHGFVLPDEVT